MIRGLTVLTVNGHHYTATISANNHKAQTVEQMATDAQRAMANGKDVAFYSARNTNGN